MSGFSNPIVGGSGALVYPAIHSPNFVHGATGWSLNKDGSAEFHSVSLPTGAGGNVITLAAGAPSGPGITAGDLWFNLGLGTVSVWTGSAWVNFAYGTGAIASSAVGLAQLSGAVTARALNGITTTIAASPPASPKAGDIWINSASGNQLEQYSGSAFVPIAWNAANVISASTITAALIAANTITAGQIAANTITAAQLAAGIVYAGIVDATTITGAQFIAFGSTGEILVYSGTPAAGNLVASVSAAAGTDAHGNAYLAGIVSYQQGSPSIAVRLNTSGSTMSFLQAASFAGPWSVIGSVTCTLAGGMSLSATGGLTWNGPTQVTSGDLTMSGRSVILGDRASPPIAAASSTAYSNSGYMHYVSSDGADYSTGRLISHAANGSSGQLVNSTGFTAITGMSVNAGAGIYRMRVVVDLTTAAAAGRWELALALGGGAAVSTVDYSFFWTSGAGVSGGAVHQTGISTTQVGPNPSVINPYHAAYEGIVRFTSAGTLSVTAATTVAADTFTVWDGSCIELVPLG